MKNLLFVCSENKLRSLTAEDVFSEVDGVNAIGCGTNKDASTPLSGDLIEWSDIVFVMENSHRRKLGSRFADLIKRKRVVCLDIQDKYDYMQPELVALLRLKVSAHV